MAIYLVINWKENCKLHICLTNLINLQNWQYFSEFAGTSQYHKSPQNIKGNSLKSFKL